MKNVTSQLKLGWKSCQSDGDKIVAAGPVLLIIFTALNNLCTSLKTLMKNLEGSIVDI
jgi:hypothetical protein